jgi:hypothetical protein
MFSPRWGSECPYRCRTKLAGTAFCRSALVHTHQSLVTPRICAQCTRQGETAPWRPLPYGDLPLRFSLTSGLGDWLAYLLSWVGFTKLRWRWWRGQLQEYCRLGAVDQACNCLGRQAALNRYGWRAADSMRWWLTWTPGPKRTREEEPVLSAAP